MEPHYEQYMKFSKLARGIYGRYTDQIEPYGMDECWLDVTGSGCMGTGFELRMRFAELLSLNWDLRFPQE